MGFQSLKIFMITLLAIIFGGMQFVCACEDAPVLEMQAHHSLQSSPQNLSVAQNTEAHHESHQHSEDCENCDTQAIVSASFDYSNLLKTNLSVIEPRPTSIKFENEFPKLTRLDLSGRRWLDPPGHTPVSLKTRLLT